MPSVVCTYYLSIELLQRKIIQKLEYKVLSRIYILKSLPPLYYEC